MCDTCIPTETMDLQKTGLRYVRALEMSNGFPKAEATYCTLPFKYFRLGLLSTFQI